MNIVLLEPKNRDNLATIIRSGQNFGVNTIFVIGGFVKQQYKGNIHKFSHQMNTQEGISSVTLLYFSTLADFLQHFPAQTTLVIVESIAESTDLRVFEHPDNATYIFGREAKGVIKSDIQLIKQSIESLQKGIPTEFLGDSGKTAYLQFVKIKTPQSLNLGVCASVVMYDRHSKLCK
jgi:tRNA(Leu) C34 or U34 (ribose-2'-O)-methylase TrmL